MLKYYLIDDIALIIKLSRDQYIVLVSGNYLDNADPAIYYTYQPGFKQYYTNRDDVWSLHWISEHEPRKKVSPEGLLTHKMFREIAKRSRDYLEALYLINVNSNPSVSTKGPNTLYLDVYDL